ncbi:MAG TPA: M6 family metalloprotease domain-containing protein [Candidatus Limnocylindrales bacterium]|nr:M6 family metalloprotease domain-containing protein [Candidatus Limnocylindrales bacterium]
MILLQFPDWPADTLNHTPAQFADLLFSRGTHPTGSLRDYYNEVSRGAFDVDGIVTKWYTAPHDYAYYANGQGGFGAAPFNAQQMALDALRLADPDVDFSQFDNDGPDGVPNSGDDDGDVDGIFIVHAGPGGEETASEGDIWSHKWNLPGGRANVDGISAFAYSTEPERWQITSPYETSGDLMSVGVYCHEFGHVLGLPDLYDTSGLPGANEGVGEWDLMASGLYNHMPGQPTGSKPAHLSAWSKMAMGWLEPTWVLRDTLAVSIPPVENTGQAFRLWTNGVDAGEYFLVENRQPIGFDAGLVRSTREADTTGNGIAHGLIIYHIDPGIIGNNLAAHKMVDIEEGSGIEQASGFTGVQNLDLQEGTFVSQMACEGRVIVRGNRGDLYDAWPGKGARTSFDAFSCPNSDSYCGGISQVAIQGITESGAAPARDVTADLIVSGTTVRRGTVIVDDSPFDGNGNNGDGLVEPGETVRLRFPLQNLDDAPTGVLTAKVRATEPYAGLLADSIYYGVIGGAAVDTGSVIYAVINPTPDPRGLNLALTVSGPAGLVLADSVQILIGQRTGICETFESTTRRWVADPIGCGGVNEWHREAGINHTPGGTWAWRLGPSGQIGHYAPAQDTRLVSQPIRIVGIADTLSFWQRYDSEYAFDGMTVEISTNSGSTWTQLTPVGDYNTGDRFSGRQTTFTEVKVPLAGYSGLVQIAFRFRSEPPNEGLGWWIDDVTVTGDHTCASTGIAVARFDAAVESDGFGPLVRLGWSVDGATGGVVGIDRAAVGSDQARHRLITLPADGEASYVDRAVSPGSYRYWLTASREGEPDAEAGPVQVTVPGGGGAAPRVFALSRVHPNPFASDASMSLSLDRDAPFVVRVFRADGRLVRTLAKGASQPAEGRVHWDGRDDRGRPAGAGIYFFELRSGNRARVQKAVLLR